MRAKWWYLDLFGGFISIEIVALFDPLWQQGLSYHRKLLNPTKATLRNNRRGLSTLTQSFCSALRSIVWDRLHRAQQKGDLSKLRSSLDRSFRGEFFWVCLSFPSTACWKRDAADRALQEHSRTYAHETDRRTFKQRSDNNGPTYQNLIYDLRAIFNILLSDGEDGWQGLQTLGAQQAKASPPRKSSVFSDQFPNWNDSVQSLIMMRLQSDINASHYSTT